MILAVPVFLIIFGVPATLVLILALAIVMAIKSGYSVKERGMALAKKPILDNLISFGIMLAIVGIWHLLAQWGVNRGILSFVVIAIYPWINWLWCQQRSGTMLRNLGRLPAAQQRLRLAALVGLFALFATGVAGWLLPTILAAPNPAAATKHLTSIVAMLLLWSYTILLVCKGLSELQLCSNGILYQGDLIPWRLMRSYQWQQRSQKTTLTIRYRRPASLQDGISWITIPESYQAELAEMISQQAPKAFLETA